MFTVYPEADLDQSYYDNVNGCVTQEEVESCGPCSPPIQYPLNGKIIQLFVRFFVYDQQWQIRQYTEGGDPSDPEAPFNALPNQLKIPSEPPNGYENHYLWQDCGYSQYPAWVMHICNDSVSSFQQGVPYVCNPVISTAKELLFYSTIPLADHGGVPVWPTNFVMNPYSDPGAGGMSVSNILAGWQDTYLVTWKDTTQQAFVGEYVGQSGVKHVFMNPLLFLLSALCAVRNPVGDKK